MDLTFIETGNPDTIDGKINFYKRVMVYKSIRELLQHQNNPYKFPAKEPFVTTFVQLPGAKDEELYKMSLVIEPRGSHKLKE